MPHSGSFIRPSSACYGYPFLQALKNKYVEAVHGTAFQEKIVLGSSNGAIEVEAVDLDKIRGKFSNLERLREVSLDNEMVSTGNNPGEILSTCPSKLVRIYSNIMRLIRSRRPRLGSFCNTCVQLGRCGDDNHRTASTRAASAQVGLVFSSFDILTLQIVATG